MEKTDNELIAEFMGIKWQESFFMDRPRSLKRDGVNGTQFVGHTQHRELDEYKAGKQRYFFIDTQESIKAEYVTINEKGEVVIKGLKTQNI